VKRKRVTLALTLGGAFALGPPAIALASP